MCSSGSSGQPQDRKQFDNACLVRVVKQARYTRYNRAMIHRRTKGANGRALGGGNPVAEFGDKQSKWRKGSPADRGRSPTTHSARSKRFAILGTMPPAAALIFWLHTRQGKEHVLPVQAPRVTFLAKQRGSPNFGHGRGRKLDKRSVMQTRERRKALRDSDDYEHGMRDSLWTEECEPMHSWQEALFPNCNTVHEMGVGHVREDPGVFQSLASGGYNEVFQFNLDLPPLGEKIVLKELTYGADYTDRNFDRVRRDALISERATHSRYVVDVLGHCGLSELAPLALGGTMSQLIDNSADEELGDETKLKLATAAAIGLADLHDLNGDGIPSVTHGDLKNNQYMLVGNRYRLGDFNRGRFLRKHRTTGLPCSYTIGKNDAKYRSPEEYRYDELTAKIDVWALGSTIFRILTGSTVWSGHKTRVVQKKIAKTNATPPLPEEYEDAENASPVTKLLVKVMYEMCFIADPETRSSAKEIAEHLQKEAKALGVDNFDVGAPT